MHGIDFTAVGGRGVYAAGLAAAVAMELDTAWFRVREKRKDHGTERVTEGARIQEQPVLVVDTVALSGQGGLLELCDLVQTEAGGRIMGVVPLVGLDDQVREEFTANFPGVIYAPLFSHQALQDL
jgi:orotate phosphoribosyltransferase